MLTRQKILLRLLTEFGDSLTKIRLVKLAFLLSETGSSECLQTFYEFLPYMYGPYSFTLNHELDNLLRAGAIKIPTNERIEITSTGKQLAQAPIDPRLLHDIETLSMQFGRLSQSALMDLVYSDFPWFTANSNSPAKRKAVRRKAPCKNYTAGYQAHQVDGLLNKLLENGIEQVFDTRLNPVSRRYGFHKSTLSMLCNKLGIHYVHVPEVGVPSEWRQELESEQTYRQLFKRYQSEILDRQPALLADLASKMTKSPTALLCRESNSCHCHRSRLANQLCSLNRLSVEELSVGDER